MRKCENCGYLASEGYEYTEYYCSAGVSEDDEHYDGEGCNYHWKTLKKRYAEIEEAQAEAYYIPICGDCLYYSKCKDKEKIKKTKTDGFDLVCDDFCRADNFVEVKPCNNCYWKSINSYHKCNNCVRNKNKKDNYKSIERSV